MAATIQAVETGDETLYVLQREDCDPVVAHWPQTLEALAPDAVRLPAHLDDDVQHAVTVTVARLRARR